MERRSFLLGVTGILLMATPNYGEPRHLGPVTVKDLEFDACDIEFTASGGTLGPFHHGLIYRCPT